MLPSDYPEAQPYPALCDLLKVQVDMQFVDLKTLLQLPRQQDGLEGGCNLTATSLVANLIAGASVLFWDSSFEALTRRGDRGERFLALMSAKYPWCDLDSVDGEFGGRLLWEHTRNPLSHTLGLSRTAELTTGIPRVRLSKSDLSREMVEEMMGSYDRLSWVGPTITRDSDTDSYTVRVPTLAWGFHRMLRDLFADEQEATRAEATATALLRR